MLELKSNIYGKFNIDSDIQKVINSQPVQRLKEISQFGIPAQYFHLDKKQCYSRFTHSVGVMLLLRYLGASKEEQIAGLIHDISHTTFSHVVDWIKDHGPDEEYQDSQLQKYFNETELPEILKELGYNPEKISNDNNFPLLEQEIPNLCADRIDYLLREISLEEAQKITNDLTVCDNEIVFKSKKTAAKFADLFLDRQMNHWGGYEAVVRYRLFANVLKRALRQDIINFDAFWGVEDPIIKKLENCDDSQIQKTLELLKQDSLEHLPAGDQVEHKKFRYVDPKFISDNKLLILSQIDEDFELRLQEAKKKNQQGIVIPEF